MIERGQASGEISKSVVPTTTSRTLLNVLIGLRVLSRNQPEKALLNSVRYQVEALLPYGENAAPPYHPISQSRKSQRRSKIFPSVAHVA